MHTSKCRGEPPLFKKCFVYQFCTPSEFPWQSWGIGPRPSLLLCPLDDTGYPVGQDSVCVWCLLHANNSRANFLEEGELPRGKDSQLNPPF